jgi:hypothetical protein
MRFALAGLRRPLRPATLSRVVLLVSGLLLPQSAQAGYSFSLDYSTLNALPSATGQNLQFVSGSYLGSTETQAFQVQPGLLHIFTPTGYFLDKGGGYQLANGYDHTLDVEYKFTTRVTAGSLSALQFTFGDSTYAGGMGIGPGRFYFPGLGNNIDLGINTAEYHTYDYVALAGTGKFTLKIDGNLAYSGNLVAGGGTPYAYFGNPYDYNNSGFVTGDITFVSYNNNNTGNISAVPEPASLLLAGIGAGLMGIPIARRRPGRGKSEEQGAA